MNKGDRWSPRKFLFSTLLRIYKIEETTCFLTGNDVKLVEHLRYCKRAVRTLNLANGADEVPQARSSCPEPGESLG